MHLGWIKLTAGITVGRVGAIPVVRPEAMNAEVGRRLPSGRITATLLGVTVGPWPL